MVTVTFNYYIDSNQYIKNISKKNIEKPIEMFRLGNEIYTALFKKSKRGSEKSKKTSKKSKKTSEKSKKTSEKSKKDL